MRLVVQNPRPGFEAGLMRCDWESQVGHEDCGCKAQPRLFSDDTNFCNRFYIDSNSRLCTHATKPPVHWLEKSITSPIANHHTSSPRAFLRSDIDRAMPVNVGSLETPLRFIDNTTTDSAPVVPHPSTLSAAF